MREGFSPAALSRAVPPSQCALRMPDASHGEVVQRLHRGEPTPVIAMAPS